MKLLKKQLKAKEAIEITTKNMEKATVTIYIVRNLTNDVFVTNVFVSMRSPVFPSFVGTGFRFRNKVS